MDTQKPTLSMLLLTTDQFHQLVTTGKILTTGDFHHFTWVLHCCQRNTEIVSKFIAENASN